MISTSPPDDDPVDHFRVRVTFDPDADAAYLKLAPFGPGDAQVQVPVAHVPNEAEIILDFNSQGQLLGVEVMGARAVLSEQLLGLAEPHPLLS